jgi:ankyrin repeat protein
VKAALGKGCDPEEVYQCGLRPLHLAALSGSNRALECLLESGADPQVILDKTQSWSGLIQGERFSIGELPEVSPLGYAIQFDNPDAVRLLAGAGVDLNGLVERPDPDPDIQQPEPAIFSAVTSDSLRALNAMLELGADPQKANAEGWTPLHRMAGWASKEAHLQATKVLLEAGADATLSNNGKSPIDWARKSSGDKNHPFAGEILAVLQASASRR